MKRLEQEDQILWQQFQQGSVAAFTTLVNRYSNTLYGYGMRFSANEELIKDCIQDVYCVLWNRKELLNEAPCVKFYLMKALRQRIIRELPKWQRTTPLDDIVLENPSFAIDLEEDTSLPRELSEKLKTHINELSPRQKELLYLRFYEGMKQEKVAELMGLSRQSAYNLQHSALIALRKLVDYQSFVAYFSMAYFVSYLLLIYI